MSAQNNARSPELLSVYLGAVSTTQTHSAAYVTRKFKITSVRISNDATLAQDATNHVTVELKNGNSTVASYSTVATTGTGPLTANVFALMTLVEAQSAVPAGSTLNLVVTIGGTGALTRARVLLEGFYV